MMGTIVLSFCGVIADERHDARGIGRDENGRDDPVMARLVEVLEIQGVVRHLIERVTGEFSGSRLEFEDKDDGSDDEEDVDPFPHSGDRVLEVDPPFIGLKSGLKDLDLLDPSVPLAQFDGEVASLCQLADDLVD